MSLIRKIFGRKKKEVQKPSIQSIAWKNLYATEQLLVTKRELLEKNIRSESAILKKNIITNKQAALNALKRKKCFIKQLSQVDGTLLNVVQERLALESANTNVIVLNAMKSSTNAVKLSNSNVDIDEIHNMINNMAESRDITKEISEALSNPVRSLTNTDEEELQKELEDLEFETLDEQVLNMDQMLTTSYPMPIVKTFETAEKNTLMEECLDDIKELFETMDMIKLIQYCG